MQIDIHFTTERIVAPGLDLPSREIGACLEFAGIVREREGEASIAGLHYEAYEPMARRLLERHLRELGARHRCASVCLIHRLGFVAVGEASLFVRVLSAHRGEALALMAAAVDRLKEDVPIWKVSPRV